jgi:YhcH/YjgK/YiaL family protein
MACTTGRVSSGDSSGAGVYRQPGFSAFAPGKIDLIPGKLFCLLQEMDSMPFAQARPESHRQFIDIQYLISGHERMGVSRVKAVASRCGGSDAAAGHSVLAGRRRETQVTLTPGMFAIFFPEDIHRPCCHPREGEQKHLRKAVIKIDRALLEDGL